ncbi:MAG: DUF4159 domain-containing protein, partial [Zetaproteobacteria bacterium]|nr:DUF4159 domain-containing protein [Zetaproteobacteria bacterium]
LRPFLLRLQERQAHAHNILLIVDLSPSVSHWATLESIHQQVSAIQHRLSPKSKLFFASSHSHQAIRVPPTNQIAEKVLSLGFHKHGFIFSEYMQNIDIETSPTIHQIVVISDGDTYSWKSTNWKYFESFSAQKLTWIDVRDFAKPEVYPSNVFIASVEPLLQLKKNYLSWNVFLQKSGNLDTESSGKLYLLDPQDQKVLQHAWKIDAHAQTTEVRAMIEKRKIPKKPALTWKIEVDAPQQDSIHLDNTFPNTSQRHQLQATLISDMTSEDKMSSPTYHIRQIFELLGHQITEKTSFTHLSESQWEKSDVTLSLVYHEKNLAEFCPLQWAHHKYPNMNADKQLWLIPLDVHQQQYKSICWCYSAIAEPNTSHTQIPTYCQDTFHRKSFANTLFGLGATQFGGQSTERASALAWISPPQSQLKMIAFSTPLTSLHLNNPTDLAQFGLLTKNILALQEKHTPVHRDTPPGTLLTERVPLGESQLQFMNLKDDPSLAALAAASITQDGITQQEQHPHPRPLIYIVLAFMTLLSFAEMVWLRRRRKASFSATLLWFMGLTLLSHNITRNHALASELQVPYLGAQNAHNIEFYTHALEQRTSIQSSSHTIPIQNHFSRAALAQPWIWTNHLHHLLKKNATHLEPRIANWIKSGGFLVIENAPPKIQLEKMTTPSMSLSKQVAEWKPIPIDHELMRSFYLLKNLPTCDHHPAWQGFYFKDRLTILAIPFAFLAAGREMECFTSAQQESLKRTFINIAMAVLTTDYKKDQIHIKEILRRIR